MRKFVDLGENLCTVLVMNSGGSQIWCRSPAKFNVFWSSEFHPYHRWESDEPTPGVPKPCPPPPSWTQRTTCQGLSAASPGEGLRGTRMTGRRSQVTGLGAGCGGRCPAWHLRASLGPRWPVADRRRTRAGSEARTGLAHGQPRGRWRVAGRPAALRATRGSLPRGGDTPMPPRAGPPRDQGLEESFVLGEGRTR